MINPITACIRIFNKMKLFTFWLLVSFSSLAYTQTSKETYTCSPCGLDCDKPVFDRPGKCPQCKMILVKQTANTQDEKPSKIRKIKIAFYLQDGVEVLDFAGPMEVFSYAGYEVFTVSKTKIPIISQGILKIIADYDIDDAPQADILAFFGGNSGIAVKDSKVINWVRSHKDVHHYFSVCTGAFILAEAGILKGKTATTFHESLDQLERDYTETRVVNNARFVDNGSVITTAGISAGIDGALHRVAKLDGLDAARKVAYFMEYDKWTPGEGMILSKENPYKNLQKTSELKAFEGRYEYLEGSNFEIKVNDREHALYAIHNGKHYPLFCTQSNKFVNLKGDDTITFIKDGFKKVIGYTLSSTKDKRYRKLR